MNSVERLDGSSLKMKMAKSRFDRLWDGDDSWDEETAWFVNIAEARLVLGDSEICNFWSIWEEFHS